MTLFAPLCVYWRINNQSTQSNWKDCALLSLLVLKAPEFPLMKHLIT